MLSGRGLPHGQAGQEGARGGRLPAAAATQPARRDHQPLAETNAGTLLAEANAPINYIMQQAGHTSPQMTLGLYAKVMNRDRGDIGERVQELLLTEPRSVGEKIEARNDGDATDAAIAELLAEH